MDDHAGRITIIASSTMVHHRVRCLICDRPVDHRVVFMTNDARVLHAGCVPDHVKVPIAVLLQAIRRLERMLARARDDAQPRDDDRAPDSDRHVPDPAATPGPAPAPSPDPAATLRPSPAPSPAATADPAATPGPGPGATPGLGEPQEPGPVS